MGECAIALFCGLQHLTGRLILTKKTILTVAFVFSVCLAVTVLGLYFILPHFLEPKLKARIESDVAKALGAQVSVEAVKFKSVYPLSLQLKNLVIHKAKPQTMSLSIKSVVLQSFINGWSWEPRKLELETYLKIDEPKAMLAFSEKSEDSDSDKPSEVSGSKASQDLSLPFETSLSVVVNNGALELKSVSPKNKVAEEWLHVDLWQLEFSKSKLMDFAAPAALDVQLQVSNKRGLEVSLPVRLTTESLLISPKALEAKDLQWDIAGVKMKGQGVTRLDPLAHNWQGQFALEDLSKLSVPPEFLPPGQWQGEVSGEFRYRQDGDSPPDVVAQLKTKGLKGQVSWRESGIVVQGPVDFLAQGQVAYQKGELSAQGLELKADLGKANLAYDRFIKKASGVPLNLHLKGYFVRSTAVVNSAEAQLAQVLAKAKGHIGFSKDGSSNFNIEIPSTELKGLEQHLPLLGRAPVQGQLQVNAVIKGVVQELSQLVIEVKPLQLKNVSAEIDYTNSDQSMSIKGPVGLNLDAQFSVANSQLQRSSVEGSLQLTSAAISLKEAFIKKAGQPLMMNLKAKGQGENLRIDLAKMSLGRSQINISGDLAQLERPQLDLSLHAPALALTELSSFLPPLAEWNLEGEASSKIRLKGQYDFEKGIEKSPMTATGYASVNMPRWIWPEKEEGAADSSVNKGAPVSVPLKSSLIPSWPLLQTSNLKTQVRIGRFTKEDLVVEGVRWDGRFEKGKLSGALSLKGLFGGQVELNQVGFDLSDTSQPASLKGRITALKMQSALAWALPEYKDWGKGTLYTHLTAQSLLPVRENWLASLKAQGSLKLDNAFLSTLVFDKMANEKLAKIPGLGNSVQVNSKGVLMDITSKFTLANKTLRFKDLNMKTPENNELNGRGRLNWNLNLDVEGNVHLVNAPVRGSVRAANSDAQGRLVVPLKIDGNLLDPDLSFAEATVETMLDKTVALEQKKLEKKVKAKVDEKIEEETEKLKKSVGKKLKKLLGN